MNGIMFGLFECVGKNHRVNKKGESKFTVKFEDEYENKLVLAVDEGTFNRFDSGQTLPWQVVRRQSTMEDHAHDPAA